MQAQSVQWKQKTTICQKIFNDRKHFNKNGEDNVMKQRQRYYTEQGNYIVSMLNSMS